jgi:1-acyl-sn-glycerol-3-phosphate acyltransferase
LSRIFSWIFRLLGWKLKGEIPAGLNKCVIIGAPHTSNWDFVFALGALHLVGYRVNYMIKKELFVFPFSYLLKKSGGIAIDRKISHHIVDEMATRIAASDQMYLVMAAEGTRKRVDHWKSGFYYVAMKANVPVIAGFLDYAKKEAGFGPIVQLTGNVENDMQKFRDFYKDITPRITNNFNVSGVKIAPRKSR